MLISADTETVPILVVRPKPVSSVVSSPTCPHSPSFQNLPPQPFSLKDSTVPTDEVNPNPVILTTGSLLSPNGPSFQVFLPQPDD